MRKIEHPDDYASALKSQTITVMVFVSDWCPDCHQTDRYLPVLSQFYPTIEFYRVNRESVPEIAEKLRVFGVPSFLVYKGDAIKETWIDRLPKPFLAVKAFLDQFCQREGCE